MEILAVKNLTFTYPMCEAPAVKDVSFSIKSGELCVLCGATGSGKSTLLRLLKRELAPRGTESGSVLFRESPINDVTAERIGFVAQYPDEQIVTDRVYSELAFGLENLGLPQSTIARRVAEMASYFGIEDWFERDISTLSGGQKQLLNLASVMVTDPDVLILDEPTSQLDPVATSDFLSTLKKLNRDLSLTVIIAEHRLEEVIPMCDRLLIMEGGTIIGNGAPRDIISKLPPDSPLLGFMPTAARLHRMLGASSKCPITVSEGRHFIESEYSNGISRLAANPYVHSEKRALEFKNVFFRYGKDEPDVLRDLSFTVYEGELFCILGGNGSGKTTALSCASGIRKAYCGQIRVFGKKFKEYAGQSLYRGCLAQLPQDVRNVFLCNTVREELEDAKADISSLPFDLSHLLSKHPYDLSGGEQQLLALAKVLATKPRLLLLDEPTKGLDAEKKAFLADILQKLKSEGVTVLAVTHDVEFAARYADRCALFFRGSIVSSGETREFFSENCFYTTSAARMTRGYFENTVTVEDIATLCRENGPRRRDYDES